MNYFSTLVYKQYFPNVMFQNLHYSCYYMWNANL